MVLHFSELKSHRNHVLQLYRCSLRAVDRQSHSVRQSLQLKGLLRQKLDNYKQLKSSWSVYKHLQLFQSLTIALAQGKFSDANNILNQHKRVKKSGDIGNVLALLEERAEPIRQSSREIREMGLLARYINHRQIRGKLPRAIPKEYRQKLLLPLAIDWDAKQRLQRLERQLARGVPKVYLSHSSVGRSTIWFVRSPLNKGKRQSKKLSRIFINTRKEHQVVLDGYAACKDDVQWALHEAMWEKYLETGELTTYSFKQEMKKFRFEKPSHSRIIGESKPLRAGIPSTNRGSKGSRPVVDKYVRGWLAPIVEVMDNLGQVEASRATYYANYRDRVLLKGKQLDYFMKRTEEMYTRRMARFKEMQSTRVSFSSPYDEDNNLALILRTYKF